MSEFTLAVNKSVLTDLLAATEQGFYKLASDTKTSGAFTASYDFGVTMKGGTLGLSPNTIDLDNVQLLCSPCTFGLTIQLPNLCTPSFTIPIINVTVPSVCLFTSPPQIHLDLDLSGYLELLVTVEAGALIKYHRNPAWTPSMSNMDAYKAKVLHAWEFYANPTKINIQMHMTGSLAAAFASAVQKAFDGLVSALPGWLQGIAWALIGPVVLLVEGIVGIVGAVGDWILGLLTTLFNLTTVLQTPIAQYFARQYFASLPDPIPVSFDDPVIQGLLPAPNPVVVWNPLFVSVRNPALTIDSNEMVLSTDIA